MRTGVLLQTNIRRAGVAAAVLVAGLIGASGAQAQAGGAPVTTKDSYTESLAFGRVPSEGPPLFQPATETITNVTVYSTQILGRLNGGTPLYDQTFGVPYSDPIAQAGVIAARAAITTAGGPGVIIGAPVLTASSSNTTSASVTTYSLAGTETTVNTVLTFGPSTIATGQLSSCNVSGLPGTTPPTCQNLPGTPYVLADGETNFNVITNTEYMIREAIDTTNTTTLFEQWTLSGTVQAFGLVHTAVQSGALDSSSRFLRRIGDETGDERPLRLWAEGYGVWSRTGARGSAPGDDRNQYGFAIGLSASVAPDVALGIAVDHGTTDIDLDRAFAENGEITLTQLGGNASLASGPWFAGLAGSLGFGRADTAHAVGGTSTTRYDLTTHGLIARAGYRLDLGGLALTPSVGIDHASVRSDGFTETGQLALTAAARTTRRSRVWAGLEVGRRGAGFDWSIHGRAVRVVSGEERLLPVTFFGAPMTVIGAAEAKFGGDAGARLAWRPAPGTELFARYDGRFRDGFTAHAASGGLAIAF